MLVLSVPAADLCVREAASGLGTGLNWTDAYTDLSSVNQGLLGAGDTLYIAGGSYGAVTITAKGNSSSNLFIKRARTTNGAAGISGWNNAYDSTVTINEGGGGSALTFDSYNGWITVDGQCTNGIVIKGPNSSSSYILTTHTTTNLTFRYLDVSGPGTTALWQAGGDGAAFYISKPGGDSQQCRNTVIEYCTIHGFNQIFFTVAINFLVQYCTIYDNNNGPPSSVTYHPNYWSMQYTVNWTNRYCTVYNWIVEGVMMISVSDPTVVQGPGYMYGNVFHNPQPVDTVARILESQDSTNGPFFIYNNTFVNITFPSIRTANSGQWKPGCVLSNNIFENSSTGDATGGGNWAAGFNLVNNSTNYFVNPAISNYTIVTNITSGYPAQAGTALAAQYSFDMNGTSRGGASGAWDIGAFVATTNTASSPTNNYPTGPFGGVAPFFDL